MPTQSHHTGPDTGPQAPADTRIYAIGDVHGRLDLLDDLLARIARDAAHAPGRKVLILLGDLIDRGADSRGVLERAAALRDGLTSVGAMAGFEVHVLKGNHEEAMLDFLDGASDGHVWLDNGGIEAIKSFGVDPTQSIGDLRPALAAALGPDLRALLDGLELTHREGDYGFVHAGVRPGVAWEDQSEQDLLWIRREFTESIADFGCVVVHGHTPAAAPEAHHNRIGIDTRAWDSGHLTCLVLEGAERRFLMT